MIARTEVKELIESHGSIESRDTIVLWEIYHWEDLDAGDYIRPALTTEKNLPSGKSRVHNSEIWIPVAFSVWPQSIDDAIDELMEDQEFNGSIDYCDPIADLLPESEKLLFS